jgi:hypothetical protein
VEDFGDAKHEEILVSRFAIVDFARDGLPAGIRERGSLRWVVGPAAGRPSGRRLLAAIVPGSVLCPATKGLRRHQIGAYAGRSKQHFARKIVIAYDQPTA